MFCIGNSDSNQSFKFLSNVTNQITRIEFVSLSQILIRVQSPQKRYIVIKNIIQNKQNSKLKKKGDSPRFGTNLYEIYNNLEFGFLGKQHVNSINNLITNSCNPPRSIIPIKTLILKTKFDLLVLFYKVKKHWKGI